MYDKPSRPVVYFALDILEMENELRELRTEVARLQVIEQQYFELLDSSIKHSQDFSNGLLKLAIGGWLKPPDQVIANPVA